MEHENRETTRTLLVENMFTGVNAGDEGGLAGGSSSVTAVVVLGAFFATCGQFGYGCASGYSSSAESGIIEDLGLSTAEYSFFASILTIGGMLGAIINGGVADLLGRRGAMWLSAVICIIGWNVVHFAKGIWWLDIGRLLMGFGYGILIYVANVYIAEITPSKIRGCFVAANAMMLCLGISLMLFIGNIFTWRNLAIVGLLPSIVQFIGIFFIPESPRWLAKISRQRETEVALQRLRGKNIDISPELTEILDYTKTFQLLSKGGILDLLQRRYARSLTIGVGLISLIQFGGNNGILYYASSIFEDAGSLASFGTMAMAIIQIPLTALSALLVDRCGRRPLLMVSAAGTCLGNILVGLAFLLQDLHRQKEITAILVLSGILVYSAFLSSGLSSAPWILMSEIFPVNVRGSAGSLVVFSNCFSAWIVSFTFSFIFEWSSAGVFFIYAAVCGLTVVFVAILVPETKGRSLEEIQASLTGLLQ
ncbi:hypothetical protein NMG60_11020686 [Bertholletia excelsa]